MRTIFCGLLALTTFGGLAVPALADEVNMQTIQQVNTQDGDLNRSYQGSSQTIRSNRTRVPEQVDSPSYGNVQDTIQDSYQRGTRNTGRQTTIQEIEMRNRTDR
jgi:hypothetical protein